MISEKEMGPEPPTPSSLEVSDQAAGAVAVAPRVTLADIEGAIADRFRLTGRQAGEVALAHGGVVDTLSREQHLDKFPSLDVLSICILVLSNGFTVIGKSAPASPENFNAELGAKLAYEDAVRQLWPLLGFNLRQKLHDASQ